MLSIIRQYSVPLVARGGFEDLGTGEIIAVTQTMRGVITKMSSGTGNLAKSIMEITARLTAYKEEHDGETIIEIDAENMIAISMGSIYWRLFVMR